MQWFVGNFGLYVGSVRGLFLSEFNEEHEAGLEASIINLKSRGFNPVVLSGEMLFKQAEFLFDQSLEKASFGRPLASKLELELTGEDIVILKDLNAPENERQLWYFYNHVIYPRVLSGKATIITTSLSYEEFLRYGAQCSDAEFGGRTITWEKLFWLIETSMMNMELFRLMREEGLPPMLKAEYYLWMSLKERGLNPTAQHVLGDYMLDLALVDKGNRLDIEVDGISGVGGYGKQTEDAKRNLVLLTDGWQILRFTTAEILNNHAGCAEVVEEVWRGGRKRLPFGRLLTGQNVADIPDLPSDDELQVAAITHGGGPAALTGGAGTGKTFCIAQRVCYLISQGVSPESILVIAHSPETLRTVRAGLEQSLDKQTTQRLHLWAWHDLGMKILKENLGAVKRKAPLKAEPSREKVIQRILSKSKKELDPITLELSTGLDEFTVATAISIYKANLVTPKQVKERAKDEIEELIAKVYQAYEDQLQRANRVDRDDMITMAVQLLIERPDVRAKYQCHFDFVLVDDYQDATVAEDTLARILASPQDNLFLVGDEDEAIYETKGGSPRLISDISHKMPQARCYVLEKNWRSHPAIVDHARQLVHGLTRRRIEKDMYSAFGSFPTSSIIGPHRLNSETEEAQWIADEIQILIDSGRTPGEMAVIYRYHRYGVILEEALAEKGVRCVASRQEAGLVPDEGEDMLAFLKLVMDPDGPKAKESFERVCQLRAKEVDPKLSTTIAGFAEANNLSYLKAVEIYSEATADQSCKELEQLVRIIRTMHQENLPPAETISLIKRTQRLSEYYKSVHVPPGVNYEPLRKLTAMEEEARKFQSVSEFVKHQLNVRQQQATGALSVDSGVHILSLHEAKGLEFPIVFMVGLAEGLFPAENAADAEEERRLCYVGFTRAKEQLYLSMPAVFNNVALSPSSFLIESRLMPAPSYAGQAAPIEAPAYPPQSGVEATANLAGYQAPPPQAPPVGPPAKISREMPAPAAPPAPETPQRKPLPDIPRPPAPQPVAQPPAQPQQAPQGPVVLPTVFASAPPEHDVPAQLVYGTTADLENQPAQELRYAEHPPAYGDDFSALQPGAYADSGHEDYQAFAPDPYYAAPAQAYYQPEPLPAQPGSALPICPSCTVTLEAGARFCGECGYHLSVRIPACTLCGSPVEPGAKFCGECGTPLKKSAGSSRPLSPGGLPMPQAKRDQHAWLVKLLKFLEPS